MTVRIVCHVEFLKFNQEAIVWKIILPDYLAGVCHYARPDWLLLLSGQVIPSREVSRGSITLREFPLVKARKSLVFACENSSHF